TLANGAKRVLGNETFSVNSPSDKYSLSLPTGSSAKTPLICVTSDYPQFRIFIQNTGNLASTLRVDLYYTDLAGKSQVVPVAHLSGGTTWAPAPQMFFLDGLSPILASDGWIKVAFKFTPE